MTDRKTVYEVIDSERNYQEQRWPRPEHRHTNTEYLVYIDHYVKQAFAAVSTQDGDSATLSALRKIAALAVAAMEENGVEYRAEGLGAYEKEVLVTCRTNRVYPHVKNETCKDVTLYESKPHTEYQVHYSESGRYVVPAHIGDTVKILPPSKPMERDSPAVGGCVIPTIKSIVPYVPTTPRNVIADIRESSVDHFVDEPDENGKRGW